ncbi:SDR family NAD(P)-dependent oxidoreductase [Micromonospora radicis]|uniref:SDR family NAD(P)-dependent oxidoreductase n=1 Tax=Micromonospora radicis TaxID=1894971 RepID=A0A418MRR8_9ACTN|nr:SDR family NAD(P)-dependent oxidoreductase [Micromonospora radicis]RIV36643.1 SDR family NAD(P)-dependent oxidoreductase [Micromonospora radicis]
MADRSVLVTGSTGGLGAAVTTAFVEAGWRVVATQRQQPTPVAPPGADAPVRLVADLTDPQDAARATQVAAGDPAAPLRAVVNLVGGYASGGLVHETPVEEFDRMLALNLRPTHLVTRAALPHLIDAGGGAVVCVAARAALAPFPGVAGYVTAKAAVLAFASAVATEYKAVGVRCNTVLPSVIDTPTNRAAMPGADHSRWVAPTEIASVIRFLASDDSAPTSGAAVPVYGRA